jgi:hypothetical protein
MGETHSFNAAAAGKILDGLSNSGPAVRLEREEGKRPALKTVTGEVMRKVIVIEFVSLDGVIQAPGWP